MGAAANLGNNKTSVSNDGRFAVCSTRWTDVESKLTWDSFQTVFSRDDDRPEILCPSGQRTALRTAAKRSKAKTEKGKDRETHPKTILIPSEEGSEWKIVLGMRFFLFVCLFVCFRWRGEIGDGDTSARTFPEIRNGRKKTISIWFIDVSSQNRLHLYSFVLMKAICFSEAELGEETPSCVIASSIRYGCVDSLTALVVVVAQAFTCRGILNDCCRNGKGNTFFFDSTFEAMEFHK